MGCLKRATMCGVMLLTMINIGCVGKNRPSATREVHMELESIFSESYQEARKKFLAAANEAGAEVESFEHPARDLTGESLHADLALLGPKNAESTLVLISATHGVEGFAGSAVQTGLLRGGIAGRVNHGNALAVMSKDHVHDVPLHVPSGVKAADAREPASKTTYSRGMARDINDDTCLLSGPAQRRSKGRTGHPKTRVLV